MVVSANPARWEQLGLSVLLMYTLTLCQVKPGIKPLTFWFVDNLHELLSHCHPKCSHIASVDNISLYYSRVLFVFPVNVHQILVTDSPDQHTPPLVHSPRHSDSLHIITHSHKKETLPFASLTGLVPTWLFQNTCQFATYLEDSSSVFHLHSPRSNGSQPPLFPWSGEPSEVRAVNHWFEQSKRVWNSVEHLPLATNRARRNGSRFGTSVSTSPAISWVPGT